MDSRWLHGIPAAIQQNGHQPPFQLPQAGNAVPQEHDGRCPELLARTAAERTEQVAVTDYDISTCPVERTFG
jgi:hypothetical protein